MTPFFNLLSKERSIVIVAHTDPDLDAISSLLTMTSLLHDRGYTVISRLENIPEGLEFLYGWELYKELENRVVPDKIDLIALDCGSIDRIWPKDIIQKAEQFINIDHHFDNPHFGKINRVDLTLSSTAEIIYHLLIEENLQPTKEMASNLFSGMLYDTGGFRYSNTKAETFVTASRMIENGANPSWLADKVFSRMDRCTFTALRLAIQNSDYLDSPSMLFSFVPYAEIEKHQLNNASFDGVIDILRQNREVSYTVLLRETKLGVWKGSVRAKEPFVIGAALKKLGGGGHKRAGGFTTASFTIEQIKEMLHKGLASDS